MALQLHNGSREKLKKLIPMLASNFDGEVIATVTAIRKVLASDGKDLLDLSAELTKRRRVVTPPDIKVLKDKLKDANAQITDLIAINKSLEAEIIVLRSQKAKSAAIYPFYLFNVHFD